MKLGELLHLGVQATGTDSAVQSGKLAGLDRPVGTTPGVVSGHGNAIGRRGKFTVNTE